MGIDAGFCGDDVFGYYFCLEVGSSASRARKVFMETKPWLGIFCLLFCRSATNQTNKPKISLIFLTKKL